MQSLGALAANNAAPSFRSDSPAPAGASAPSSTPEPLFPNEPAPSAPSSKPSQNVTINLINRLVQRKVLTKDDAADLIRQAEADADAARAEVKQEATAAVAAEAPPPATDDDVRVTYIPEVVKAQMRDEIKQEVMQQARDENWASPRALPSWVPRLRITGDFRMRYEGDFYPSGNDNTGAFPIFNSINTGAPFDTSGTVFSPQYNVDQNRNRFRIRARLGAEIDLGENFTAGLRLGSGQDDSPVTENQTLGLANGGQGGNFAKYQIWLDRAFLKYEIGTSSKGVTLTVGRFDRPFFDPTTIIWANDLGFDGGVAQARYEVAKGVTPYFTVGAFPVFNTDFNFATNNPSKFRSQDKWLYGGQIGTDWKITKDISTKVGGAYYYFQNIDGRKSSPFTPLTTSDAGNTDDTRPSFAQNGNTYFPLRNIVPTANNSFGTIDQFQYYGLATPFHELAFTGRLDYTHFEPITLSLVGEFEENVAFDRSSVAAKAVNNLGANLPSGKTGSFAGGNTAWTINFNVGTAALEKAWDWNAGVGYRYVESDSVVDGFADADFGAPLTGTNLQGYTVTGSVALSSRVWLFLRYMAADAIAGPTYRNDIIQFDVNAKF